jgi:hypothetical protein
MGSPVLSSDLPSVLWSGSVVWLPCRAAAIGDERGGEHELGAAMSSIASSTRRLAGRGVVAADARGAARRRAAAAEPPPPTIATAISLHAIARLALELIRAGTMRRDIEAIGA